MLPDPSAVPDADQVADLLLPLGGPYHPDRVAEAARTIGELVRRLNHATFHRNALRYPPQVYRTVSGLRSGLYGLEQTLSQLATRLDAFAADSRVEHDQRHNPSLACTQAADDLRRAGDVIGAVTTALDAAAQTTSHLGYDTTTSPRTFPAPHPPPSVHQGQSPRDRTSAHIPPPEDPTSGATRRGTASR